MGAYADRQDFADGLSVRQEQAVACIFRGLCTSDIARELEVSRQTAKNLLCRAYRKLGVGSRYELIAQAASAGGLALWLYNGETRVEPAPKRYETAADKRAAEAIAVRRPADPAWLSRFTSVRPTTHERRLIEILLADPERASSSIARQVRSSAHGVDQCLSRIYNKAGVRTRAGLIGLLLR